jgi:hypothetical protein
MGAEYGVTPRPHNGPSPPRRPPQRVVREGRCAARPAGYNAGPFIPPTWISWASGALGEGQKAKRNRRCCAGWAVLARRSPLRSSFCCPSSPCRRRLSRSRAPQRAGPPRRPHRSWPRRPPSGAVRPSASPAASRLIQTSKARTSPIPARSAGPCSRRRAICRRACRPSLWRRRRFGSRRRSLPAISRFAEISPRPSRAALPSSERSIRLSPRGSRRPRLIAFRRRTTT